MAKIRREKRELEKKEKKEVGVMRKCDLNDRRLLLSVALETMFSFSHWMWHHNLESIII